MRLRRGAVAVTMPALLAVAALLLTGLAEQLLALVRRSLMQLAGF